MRVARSYSGKAKIELGPRTREELASTCSAKEECFSILSSFSEVDDNGIKLIKSKGHRDAKKVYLEFQAYIRQAKSFYDSAEELHYRSSSLLYYYSFLNLAKALVCLKKPSLLRSSSSKKKIYHGLTTDKISPIFNEQTISVKKEGIFPLLYEQVTEENLPKKVNLNIVRLIGYCTDIGYENQISELSDANWNSTLRAYSRQALDANSTKSWGIIALPYFAIPKGNRKFFKKFNEVFEEVEMPPALGLDLFNYTQVPFDFYNFYETKKQYPVIMGKYFPPNLKAEMYEALENLYLSSPYRENHDFFISTPLRPNLQIPFNEILAIYSIMFFLGDLVRYKPKYIESLLASKEAWILERFVNSCPITFLKHMTNLILEKDYVFYSR